jgi:hypothetical protein
VGGYVNIAKYWFLSQGNRLNVIERIG